MSAFVVSKEHIQAMVRLAHTGPRDGRGGWNLSRFSYFHEGTLHRADGEGDVMEGLSRTMDMLVTENVRSVMHRYPDTIESGNLPGPIDHYWETPLRYSLQSKAPTAVEGLKLIQCYEYQSCEHPEWESSAAKAFCDALTSRLIGELAGYDEAPWEWSIPAAA